MVKKHLDISVAVLYTDKIGQFDTYEKPDVPVLWQLKTDGYRAWPNRWSLPGGGIKESEKDDKGLTTICRELGEEIGFVPSDLRFSPVWEYDYEEDEDFGNKEGRFYIRTAKLDIPLSRLRLGEGSGAVFLNPELLAVYNQTSLPEDKRPGGMVIPHDWNIVQEVYKSFRT